MPERAKIFENLSGICETVSTIKQREKSFVILSRSYLNPSLNDAWFNNCIREKNQMIVISYTAIKCTQARTNFRPIVPTFRAS